MPTLAPHLAVEMTVAAPTVVGSLAVFPLIADREPSVRYISFAEAVQQGATVKELGGGASVNDLVVHNPLDVQVLLYEGEEVLGAQQNRTFDASALVGGPLRAAGAGQLRGGGAVGRGAPRRVVRPGAADGEPASAPDEEHAGTREPRRRDGGACGARRGLAGGRRHRRSPRRQLPYGRDARRVRAPPRTARGSRARCRDALQPGRHARGDRRPLRRARPRQRSRGVRRAPRSARSGLRARRARGARGDAAVDRGRSRVHRAAARRPVHAGARRSGSARGCGSRSAGSPAPA